MGRRSTRTARRLIEEESDDHVDTAPAQNQLQEVEEHKSRWRKRYKMLRVLAEIGRSYLLLSLLALILIAQLCEGQHTESSVTNSRSVSQQRVTISTSYSATNLAALPPEANNVNLSLVNATSYYSPLSVPIKAPNVTPVYSVPAIRVTTLNSTTINRRRRPGLRSSSINKIKEYHGNQPAGTDTFEKRIFKLPSFLSTLSNLPTSWQPTLNVNRNDHAQSDKADRSSTERPGGETSTIKTPRTKPTMTPLRVLQTEINQTEVKKKASKTRQAEPEVEPLETQTPRTLTATASGSSSGHKRKNKAKVVDKNLANHRLETSSMTPEVRDQLDLINQRFSHQLRNKTDPSDTETLVKESRTEGGASVSRNKAQSQYKEQSKQLKFNHPFNYMQGYTDNIAEEDQFHGVTDISSMYPMYANPHDDQLSAEVYPTVMNPNYGYEVPSGPPSYYIPPKSASHHRTKGGKKSKHRHKDHNKLEEQKQVSITAASSAQNQPDPPSQQPQILEPVVSDATHQNNYSPAYHNQNHYKSEYYAGNGVSGSYHANDPRVPSGSNPERPTYPQSNGYGPLSTPYHYGSPYPEDLPAKEPSASYSYNSNQYASPNYNSPNYRPSIQGDNSLEGTNHVPDTIMDRFEVFYAEHKLLTWGAFFILGGLALLTIVCYLWINNPPTEVVTARSLIDHYLLRDPAILKFLSTVFEPSDPSQRTGNSSSVQRRRNKRQRKVNEGTSKAAVPAVGQHPPHLVIQKAKAL